MWHPAETNLIWWALEWALLPAEINLRCPKSLRICMPSPDFLAFKVYDISDGQADRQTHCQTDRRAWLDLLTFVTFFFFHEK